MIVFSSSKHNQEEVIFGVNSVSRGAEVVGCSDAGEIIVRDNKNNYSGSVVVIDTVHEVIRRSVPIIGFYTYGEVGHFKTEGRKSVFHNETMNLLLLS